MNMPLQRTTQSSPFAADLPLAKTSVPACTGKASALPPALAGALGAAVMLMLKNMQMAQGGRRHGPEGAATQPSAGHMGRVSRDAGAAEGGKTAGTQACMARPAQQKNEGFDFQLFAQLVAQLCNSAFSSGAAVTNGQSQEGAGDACQAQQPEGEALDPQVEETRMETIAILGRHEDKFKKAVDEKGIDKMINDKDTPPDLVRALKNLKADPQMMEALDKAKNGKTDHKISAEDINKLQANDANRAFAEKKAESFEQTYIPSDCKDPNAKPRPITNNDAQRELFRYSDYLPKHVSRESLQKIVDGTAAQGKAPPQLVAAAKFYVDHPEAWEKDMGKGANDSIRKDGICNRFAKSMELTADEDKTLKVLDENRSTFFGKGNLTDAKLKQISEDPDAKPEVREAAQSLRDKKGSLLYAMLDNGKHGHGGNLIHAADDHSIGSGDLDKVLAQRNKQVAPAEKTEPADKTAAAAKTGPAQKTAAASDPMAAQAAQDMSDGQRDQPDAKKKKGGQLRDIATFFLKAYSFVTHVASQVLSAVAALKIPGVSWLAAAGAMGAETASGAAKIGATALQGGDVKGAAKSAGIGLATTAAGLLIPGGGKIVGEAAEVGAKEAGKSWSKQAVNEATDITNGQLAKFAGKEAAKGTAKTAASTAFTESGAKAEVTGRATNEYHART